MEQNPEEKSGYLAEERGSAVSTESEESASNKSGVVDYPEVPFEIPRD